MLKKSIIFLVLMTVSSFSYAKKETDKPQSITSVINLYGVAFSYGSPPWIEVAINIAKESKFYKNQQGRDFIYEAIPSDETFENWKTMYAVKARKARQNVTLTAWEDSNINVFKKACQDVKIKYLVMDVNVSFAQIICPKVVNFNLHGYENGVGEVGLFAFLKHDNVFISHYIEWRGDAFDAHDRESWPVDEEQLNKAIANLKKASTFKDGKVVSFK